MNRVIPIKKNKILTVLPILFLTVFWVLREFRRPSTVCFSTYNNSLFSRIRYPYNTSPKKDDHDIGQLLYHFILFFWNLPKIDRPKRNF